MPQEECLHYLLGVASNAAEQGYAGYHTCAVSFFFFSTVLIRCSILTRVARRSILSFSLSFSRVDTNDALLGVAAGR